jgi:hypothetical protein
MWISSFKLKKIYIYIEFHVVNFIVPTAAMYIYDYEVYFKLKRKRPDENDRVWYNIYKK